MYIVDDDKALCKSLSWLLKSANLVSAAYHSGPHFLEAYQAEWRGCILMDVRMPEMSGLQLQEKLIKLKNAIPIIMLSGHADIGMAVRAMKAGAVDFITKPFNDQQLLDQIQNVLSYRPAENIMSIENRYNTLSDREKEVFFKIVQGQMNKNIAADLKLSPKTVEIHRANLMQKMQAEHLPALVQMYCLMQKTELVARQALADYE